jgi:metal-responsive CopG/Arc/MetJ family transcriptional regulator
VRLVGRLKVVSFKLEEDLAMEFYEIVYKKRRQVSEVLRELIREYVEREKYREVKEPRKIKVY